MGRVQTAGVVSFPPSFARTFSSKERRLGTRQTAVAQRLKQAQVISPLIWHQPRDTDASVMISYKYWSSRPGHACPAINYFKVTFFGTFIIWISFVPIWLLYVLYLVVGLSLNPFSILAAITTDVGKQYHCQNIVLLNNKTKGLAKIVRYNEVSLYRGIFPYILLLLG